METKLFEIRDAATFIPALAIRLGPSILLGDLAESERYLTSRAGFGTTVREQREYVLLMRLTDHTIEYDPIGWGGSARTMPEAHKYIIEHFHELDSGAVVDVQFILGEKEEPKVSEAVTFP